MTNVQRTSVISGAKSVLCDICLPWNSFISQRRVGHGGFSADDPPHGGITAQTLSVIHVLIAHPSDFDTAFYAVQALELLAGATNITLLILDMRDGPAIEGMIAVPGRVITRCWTAF